MKHPKPQPVACASARIGTYALVVRTPDEAASLAASGCGCDGGEFAAVAPLEEVPQTTVTWSGVIGVENELTGDGRLIESNALIWENLPLPIRYAPIDNGGHQGAQVVGRIITLERRDNGEIFGTGDFDTASDIAREAIRQVGEKFTNGISMDLDSVAFDIRVAREILEEHQQIMEEGPADAADDNPVDDEGRVTVVSMSADDEIMVTTSARVRAATIVSIPAFATANIFLDDEVPTEEALVASAGQSLTLLVAGAAPMEPPATWFADPGLTGPTPLTITEDGRVFGHLAAWGTCHTAYSGQCVEPPHSATNYAYFHTGAVRTAEGTDVPVGVVTLDTLHAGRTLSAVDTLAHYEHTGKQAADVAVGEDAFGIWVAGAIRPGLPTEKIRALRASPLSGDWRSIAGNLELVAALAVNSPGFPIPRPQGLTASGGGMHSLVASGMLAPGETPDTSGLTTEDVHYLKALAAREKASALAVAPEAVEARRTKATELAARTRKIRAAALAAKVASL